MADLTALKQVAEKANLHSEQIGEEAWFSVNEVMSMMLAHHNDATHMATFSPSVVLALIAVAEKAKAYLDSEGSGCGAEIERETELRSALAELEK